MEPFLISTNTDLINSQQAAVNATVVYYQGIYDALKPIGITPTLAEINSLAQWTRGKNGTVGFAQNYVADKLIAIAGNVNFNGISLDPTKLRSLIVMPDLTALTAALSAGVINPSDIGYMQLENDVISKIATADDNITQANSFYTRADESTTLANNLQTLCDTLNAFDAANNNRLSNGIKNINYRFTDAFGQVANLSISQVVGSALSGLDFIGGKYCVSLRAIRSYESVYLNIK